MNSLSYFISCSDTKFKVLLNTDAVNLQSSGNTAPYSGNSSNDDGTMRLYPLYLSGSRQETVMGYCWQESDRLDSTNSTQFLEWLWAYQLLQEDSDPNPELLSTDILTSIV